MVPQPFLHVHQAEVLTTKNRKNRIKTRGLMMNAFFILVDVASSNLSDISPDHSSDFQSSDSEESSSSSDDSSSGSDTASSDRVRVSSGKRHINVR